MEANKTPEVKPEVKKEIIPAGKVKMINCGITRIVPENQINEFKKRGFTVV